MILSTAYEDPTIRSRGSGGGNRLIRERKGGAEQPAIRITARAVPPELFDEKMEILVAALQRTGRRQLLEVRPRLAGNALHLEGDVTCFYLKQLAQEAVRPHSFGLQICNDLRVAPL